ncbi:MAG: hypothetical protein GX097_02655 [Methanomicrobiales archaeon]|jgi:hypothetical protein|nr:hypothetical protein [Methanomicrobiales archaeon]
MQREKPCTVKDNQNCAHCGLQGSLDCRWDKNILTSFIAVASPIFIGVFLILGIIFLISGQWWPIVTYVLFLFLIFGYEIKFLCSHCPFYECEGKFLKCLAYSGAPKIFTYNPAPLSRFEKFMVNFVIWMNCIIIPLSAGIVSLWMLYYQNATTIILYGTAGIFAMTLLAIIVFLQIIKVYYCAKCVNFSCPLNTVEKRVVDEYLLKNDVMREAWEKSGYKLG